MPITEEAYTALIQQLITTLLAKVDLESRVSVLENKVSLLENKVSRV